MKGSTRPGERAADAASDPPISAALPAIAALLVSPSAGSLEARATPTVDRLNFLSRGKDAPSPLADLTAEMARVAVAVARTVLAVFEIIPRVVSLVARLLGGPRRPATFSKTGVVSSWPPAHPKWIEIAFFASWKSWTGSEVELVAVRGYLQESQTEEKAYSFCWS